MKELNFMNNPRLFISYSHESAEHNEWIKQLATVLRKNGVDVILDQWDLHPGQDITTFMENGLLQADRVLAICSETYLKKANENKGGVGYEKMIVNADILKDLSSTKYIPIIPFGAKIDMLPAFLGARLYMDFREASKFNENLNSLLKEIHLGYVQEKPGLGNSPFKETDDLIDNNVNSVNLDWLFQHTERALNSLEAMGFTTFMEVKSFPLTEFKIPSQKAILEAVRNSQIHTFGWPICLILNSNDENRPKPLSDGIYSEIRINDSSLLHEKSYDYWAISNSGIVFLLKSLFEDLRDPTAIFFNSRIVRNAEVILFCKSLYTQLGLDSNSEIEIIFRYSGLKERYLKSSTTNRYYHPKQTFENEVTTHIVVPIADIDNNLIHLTQEVTEPLFSVFEFSEFADPIYEQIITDFLNRKVT